jgi:hypothetical protein
MWYGIVLSHFDHSCFVWDNCADYLLDKLEKPQNWAARVITGKTYDMKVRAVARRDNGGGGGGYIHVHLP